MEHNSAKKIQRWWRSKLEKDQNVAHRARQLADNKYLSQITLHNDHLISKLEKLRKEKAEDVIRYERILNMPARDVNHFMKNQMNKKLLESDSGLGQREVKKRHAAAIVIQKCFRNYCKQIISEKYRRSLKIIKPNKRVDYLAQINDKLSNKKTVMVIPFEEIRTKLNQHQTLKEQDAATFAKRQMLIQEMKHASISITLASLELLNTTNLNVSTPLINYKARQRHSEEMEKIEENEWKR